MKVAKDRQLAERRGWRRKYAFDIFMKLSTESKNLNSRLPQDLIGIAQKSIEIADILIEALEEREEKGER